MAEEEKKQIEVIWDYIRLIADFAGTEIIALFAFMFILKAIDGTVIPLLVFQVLMNGTLFLIFALICFNIALSIYDKTKKAIAKTNVEVKLTTAEIKSLQEREKEIKEELGIS